MGIVVIPGIRVGVWLNAEKTVAFMEKNDFSQKDVADGSFNGGRYRHYMRTQWPGLMVQSFACPATGSRNYYAFFEDCTQDCIIEVEPLLERFGTSKKLKHGSAADLYALVKRIDPESTEKICVHSMLIVDSDDY